MSRAFGRLALGGVVCCLGIFVGNNFGGGVPRALALAGFTCAAGEMCNDPSFDITTNGWTDTGATCSLPGNGGQGHCFRPGNAASPVTPNQSPVTSGSGVSSNTSNTSNSNTGASSQVAQTASRGVVIPTSAQTGLSDRSVIDVLSGFASSLLEIFGVLAIIAFVISGLQYLLAAGDEKSADIAKKNLKYSVIAIIIVLSGVIIINAIDAIFSANKSSFF